jgi:hypothetical protein
MDIEIRLIDLAAHVGSADGRKVDKPAQHERGVETETKVSEGPPIHRELRVCRRRGERYSGGEGK